MPNYRRATTPGAVYFFTVVTHRRRPILTRPDSVVTLREAIRDTRLTLPFEILAWVLLPDHLHCLWRLPVGDRDFSKRWGLIKAGFSKRIAGTLPETEGPIPSRLAHRERAVWQRRFWEHQIRGEEDMRRHMDYIHYNPVRHGHVERVGDWPYSTFHRCVRQGVYPEAWGGCAEEAGKDVEFGE
jgi:putative transposase